MPDAYLILCHNGAAQINALCAHISAAGHDFYLHADASSKLAADLKLSAQVQLVNKPVSVGWGDWSMIEATLRGVAQILQSGKRYRYIHLLSGACMPAMPLAQLDSQLEQSAQKQWQWMECEPLPRHYWGAFDGGLYRVKTWFPRRMVNRQSCWHRYFNFYVRAWRKLKLCRPSYKTWAPFYGGSQWWSLTHEMLERMMAAHAQRPQMARFYRHVFAPDEHYFQHLLALAGGLEQLAPSNGRFFIWPAGQHSPSELRRSDWPTLRASGALFARKFALSADECAEYLNELSAPYFLRG